METNGIRINEAELTLSRQVAYRVLRRNNPGLSHDQVEDFLQDAVVAVLSRVDTFDPTRAALSTLLVLIAQRRVYDMLRSPRGRLEMVSESPARELESELRRCRGENEPERIAIVGALEDSIRSVLPDPKDQAVLEFVSSGRTNTEAYAELIEDDLSPEELRREAKRMRDRVCARLRRRRDVFLPYLS